MRKRVFNWTHSKDKRYVSRECPDFDFIEGCKTGLVVWWNENQFCIDLDKLKATADNNDLIKVCLQCGGTGVMGNEEINAECDSCLGTGKPIIKS